MKRLLLLSTLLATASAYAGPFKETLSRDEIEAITKAVQAALPPVDATAKTTCQPMLDAYNKAPETSGDKVVEAAKCLRTAGALGASIMMWKTALKYPVKGKEAESLREAGSAEEAAAMYNQAAGHYEQYWGSYGPGTLEAKPDATALLIRATCIRRQMGDDTKANTDFQYVTRGDKKTAYDSNKLCDAIRPIAMPAKSP